MNSGGKRILFLLGVVAGIALTSGAFLMLEARSIARIAIESYVRENPPSVIAAAEVPKAAVETAVVLEEEKTALPARAQALPLTQEDEIVLETRWPDINLREGPGELFSIVARAKHPYRFHAVAAERKWFKVITSVGDEDHTAWVRGDQVRVITEKTGSP